MSTGSLEEILDAARKLPLEQRRLLAEELIRDTSRSSVTSSTTRDALDAVERTHGAIRGLDRDTVIWLAEDEELCGY